MAPLAVQAPWDVDICLVPTYALRRPNYYSSNADFPDSLLERSHREDSRKLVLT